MMMICWAFAALTLLAALTAAMTENMRRAALALWIAGLGMGGMYLTLGAETLAVIQWILSTLAAISLVFFAVTFGEYARQPNTVDRKRILFSFLGGAIGLAFASVIFFGVGGGARLPESAFNFPAQGNDLAALGRTLAQDHLLSLEMLALTLFLILVGGGVVARPEAATADELELPSGKGTRASVSLPTPALQTSRTNDARPSEREAQAERAKERGQAGAGPAEPGKPKAEAKQAKKRGPAEAGFAESSERVARAELANTMENEK